MGDFSSILWRLLVPLLLLFNSTSTTCRLGHHGVWIRAPPFLQMAKELIPHNYFFKLQSSLGQSTSHPTSWSHHSINLLDTIILSNPVHSSYMVWQATILVQVACLRWMYSLILVPLLLLFNSTSTTCRLGHHGVWIRAPPFLQMAKELIPHNYFFKLQSSLGQSTSHPTSWSHHSINLLDTIILSNPVHSSYMVWQATILVQVACLRWMYSLIGQNPVVSSVLATEGNSHSPTVVCQGVFPAIVMTAWWWNHSINFKMSPFTTKIFIPYSSTVWTTDL